MSNKQELLKPVQLQVNNTGAWKTICRFSAEDVQAGIHVMDAAHSLQQVDATLKFRIATADALASPLMYLEKGQWKSVV